MKTELLVGIIIGAFFGLTVGFIATKMHYEEQIAARGYGSFKLDRHGGEYFEWNTK